jgi:glycosyltransferase involved in cell wall biosynthesis
MASPEKPPFISILLPVCNGTSTIDRALRSIKSQTFADWEVVAVDDASDDGTYEAIRRWAAKDPRIHVFRLDENSGPSAARNAAFRQARGEFVTYLDHDDEYYADYLEHVAKHCDKAGVLLFGYDVVYEDGPAEGREETWDPAIMRQHLFARNVVAPLGVAHRRKLWEQVGGFNERLWIAVDWDFYKRLARAGADFAFLPLKSGLCHAWPGSLSHMSHPTPRQRESAEANRNAGKPIFGDRPLGTRCRKVQKIAFVSPHCIVDRTSGAAISICETLQFLATLGFQCQAMCGSRLDAKEEAVMEEIMAQQGTPYTVHRARIGPYEGRMMLTSQGSVPVTIFENASTRGGWLSTTEAEAFLTACKLFLTKNRPDAVLTYGGDPVSLAVVTLAKTLDIPVVFCLRNFGYHVVEPFVSVDYVVVPSEFSRQVHWSKLGLACHNLPQVVDWRRIETARQGPQYVTFVNPEPAKGVFVFARIAEVLAGRRPDIPLLVVEGRGNRDRLKQAGLDISGLPNLRIMESTHDPRKFYAASKLILMPSLWNESFGRVAAEAMVNGIPVLASNRGALPETVGDGGFLFDVPVCYTPESRTSPTAEEVEPWVETIVRLWDDAAWYDRWSHAARERARLWHPDRLAPIYREFFGNLFPQPGPPLVPK